MSDIASLSAKPDKCHILKSTVDQIQQMKRRALEKAALLSPDDEVQKSDISSSSQGLVEKEALGPMLLEVNITYTIISSSSTTAGSFISNSHNLVSGGNS
ncbi:hypothetical protein F7725_019908 [Dissostichus mawsoni]|uniref:Nuclear receptor coactivator 1-3 bHLH domain-containing protein n=1 Tax=Dissostichus mawsoni TaxID=36200 RepID=A0A7J5YN45_DISMA|nr:hypothetical protein F7725_019908 [Dissostichus mawsoni]